MTRRSGLTLVEVLTALFILALGVIAILTMFPLGASQMAIAVRDSRSTEAAFNADSYMRTYWKTQVVEQNGGGEFFYAALNDPNSGPGAALPNAGLTALTGLETDPSYPVAVDPMGYAITSFPSNPSRSQFWIGDSPTAMPRRNLNAITSTQLAQRTCTLMDTLGYDEFGAPTDDREMRYNWLWVIQRPNNSNRFTANMTIVVFDRRSHLYAPPGSEAVYQGVVASPGTSSLTFPATSTTGNPFDLKPGAWIMDGTVGTAPSTMRNANFYRVTAINGNTVELQSPIKVPSDNINAPYTGTFVVLRGVSGVFARPPLTAGD